MLKNDDKLKRKLSYSSVNTYSICARKYRLQYVEGWREKTLRSSLLFGSAIDQALNELLVSRDLDKATSVFEKSWNFATVNNNYIALKSNPDIVYSNADLDFELIEATEEEKAWTDEFIEYKKTVKWQDIPEESRIPYNEYCWATMLAKGKIMLNSYAEKVLPQFLKVEAVQEKVEVANTDGDILVQHLDFIAHFQDSSIILMDNKTTSSMKYYPDDAAGKAPQLLGYYAMSKEKFKLEGVGFVAIGKNIVKNKTKTCKVCGAVGTDSKARTCDKEYSKMVLKRKKEVEQLVRCGGDWDVKLGKLEAAIKIIVNPVDEEVMNTAIEFIDTANQGIKAGNFEPNLQSCDNQYGSRCPFYDVCHHDDFSNVVKKEE